MNHEAQNNLLKDNAEDLLGLYIWAHLLNKTESTHTGKDW